MEFRLLGLFWMLPVVSATVVQMESIWEANFGWKITCSWKLFPDDALQSVKLYNSVQQFMIYRPIGDGTQTTQQFSLPDNVLQVFCREIEGNGTTGECVISLELYQPQREDLTYACEVSGERPLFRIGKKEIVVPALVQPSAAVINVVEEHPLGRATLNCSSAGVPAPSLIWTIDNQKEPQTFSASHWNVTSKLWHVWSIFIYTPSENHSSGAVCTPEVIKSNKTYTGSAKEYNSANSVGTSTFVIVMLSSLILLR